MNQKQHAPGAQGKHAGAFYQVLYKGREFYLNNNEFRVFSLLVCGGQWATFDIAERLNIPDPRSTIRYIRKWGSMLPMSGCMKTRCGLSAITFTEGTAMSRRNSLFLPFLSGCDGGAFTQRIPAVYECDSNVWT